MIVIYEGRKYRVLRFGRVQRVDVGGRYKPAASASTTKAILDRLIKLGLKRQHWSGRAAGPFDLGSIAKTLGSELDLDQVATPAATSSWLRATKGSRSTTLSPLQVAIRSADRVWGTDLVDVAIAVAQQLGAGDDVAAAATIAAVRQSRRVQMMRLGRELLAISEGRRS